MDLAQRVARRFMSDPDNISERDAIAALLMPSDVMERFFFIIAKQTSMSGDYNAERITQAFIAHVREIYEDRMRRIGPLLESLGQLNLSGKFAGQFARISECYQ